MLRPIDTRILVVPITEKEKMYGKIVVTNLADEKPTLGTVKAVGPRVVNVEAGDVVVYGRYAGTTITIGWDDYLLVEESDILGVWEEDAAPLSEPTRPLAKTPLVPTQAVSAT